MSDQRHLLDDLLEQKQNGVKVKHRTSNFEVSIDENTGRKLKVSVDVEKNDFIIHGIPNLLKEAENFKFNQQSIDVDIRALDELFKHTMALLYSARNSGRLETEV
jgi:hypothetical protein